MKRHKITLKRFGRCVKACGSTSINKKPMNKDEFMKEVYFPWKHDPNIRRELENNYVLSAQIKIQKTERILEENIRTGRADEEFVRWAKSTIERSKQVIANHEASG